MIPARFARTILAAVAAAAAPATLMAQVVSFEQFNNPGTPWTANGIETIYDDGRGVDGPYLVLPDMDFLGAHLRTEDPASGLIGDLTRYPNGLRISFDMRTFRFDNFDGLPIDPASRPVIFQLWDRGDPENFEDDVSVWVEGDHIPPQDAGWLTMTFTLPNPNQTELPPGWGGTGAEDPVTFEPILPPGRTFASVLASVDEVQFTTFKPGYFYGFSFWEIGYDNIRIEQPTPACACDVNSSGQVTTQDIFDFLAAYFSGDLEAGDFNDDQAVTIQDIFDFLACYFTPC